MRTKGMLYILNRPEASSPSSAAAAATPHKIWTTLRCLLRNGAGKGDRPRPTSISKKEYDKRWDKIFKKKESHGKTKKDKTD